MPANPGKLVADIGGTNARFALSRDSGLTPSVTLPVKDYADPIGAISAAREMLGAVEPHAIDLAVAGIVDGGVAKLTNGDWTFGAKEISSFFENLPVRLFNDVQAAALALPHLAEADLVPLGGAGQADAALPLALLNVGTGLGVSCHVVSNGQPIALATEAGHATLPAPSEAERKIVGTLEEKFGHVSAERVLSGAGLSNLYAAMTGTDEMPAARIVEEAVASEANAAAVLNQFCAFLGAVAGDLALVYGAWGGVFIGGGMPRRFPEFLARSQFRARFEAKGRFSSRPREVPTILITNDETALLGLENQPLG